MLNTSKNEFETIKGDSENSGNEEEQNILKSRERDSENMSEHLQNVSSDEEKTSDNLKQRTGVSSSTAQL